MSFKTIHRSPGDEGGSPTPEELAAQKAQADKEAAEKATAEAEAIAKNPKHWEDEARRHANEARNLRDAKAAAEAELETLRKEKAEREKAEMTDIDRAKAEAAEALKRAEQAETDARNTKIELAASKLGFNDPADAVAFLDVTKINKDGSNLESLLKKVLETKPYLAKSAEAPKGTGSSFASNPPSGDAAGRVTSESELSAMKNVLPALKRVIIPSS